MEKTGSRIVIQLSHDVPRRDGFDYSTDLRNSAESWPELIRVEAGSRWREPGDERDSSRACWAVRWSCMDLEPRPGVRGLGDRILAGPATTRGPRRALRDLDRRSASFPSAAADA